jgi:DNA gyrase/topoisomerase IV subunit B
MTHSPVRPVSKRRSSFTVCVRNGSYPASLELRKIYETLADADAARNGQIRVIDESGEDYLYPARYFAAIDLTPSLSSAGGGVTASSGKNPEIGRFKGLGEMMPAQLKDTTMNPATRTMARVALPKSVKEIDKLVETLMGKKPELRFKFIQDNAKFVDELDV